jgi:hypothetical protein
MKTWIWMIKVNYTLFKVGWEKDKEKINGLLTISIYIYHLFSKIILEDRIDKKKNFNFTPLY